jgi:cyclic beta-1,2-glucan synthetase
MDGIRTEKRKIKAPHQLLRGDKSEFSVIVGVERKYTSVKYVITLDTDTQLPRMQLGKWWG